MATLVIPNTFVAGTTIVSADMNDNFTEVATVINTTKLDHDNLNFAYQDVVIGPFHIERLVPAASASWAWQPVISVGTLTPLRVSGLVMTVAGAGALTINIFRNPASLTIPTAAESILNSAIVISAAASLTTSANFKPAADSDFASGDVMLIRATETGGSNILNLSITLQAVMKHRASP